MKAGPRGLVDPSLWLSSFCRGASVRTTIKVALCGRSLFPGRPHCFSRSSGGSPEWVHRSRRCRQDAGRLIADANERNRWLDKSLIFHVAGNRFWPSSSVGKQPSSARDAVRCSNARQRPWATRRRQRPVPSSLISESPNMSGVNRCACLRSPRKQENASHFSHSRYCAALMSKAALSVAASLHYIRIESRCVGEKK